MGYGLASLASRLIPRRPQEEDQSAGLTLTPRPIPVDAEEAPTASRLIPRSGLAKGVEEQFRLVPRSELAAAPAPEPLPLAPRAPRDMEEYLSSPTSRYSQPVPPTVSSIDPSGHGSEAAPSFEPRYTDPGRAPTPPLRAYSQSYGRYQDESARLPSERDYIEANRPHGFKQRLMQDLKLGGKFLVQSGLNPVVAAEGLAIGALDRDAYNRYSYRTDVEPRSIQRQQRYLGDASRELGMTNIVDDNRRADEQMRLNADWHQTQVQGHNQEWQERLQEKTLNDWMARNPGVPIPRQIAEQVGHSYLAGYTPPAKRSGAGGRTPHVLFNAKTGEVGVVTYDENDTPTLTKPQGGQMQPTPDTGADTTVTTQDEYGYPGGETPEQYAERTQTYLTHIDSLVARGEMLPKDGEDLKNQWRRENAPRKTGERRLTSKTGGRLTPRSQVQSGASGKTKLSADQVRQYADANGWTPERAASYLRSTGKYIVP